jgi:ADP-heptose:LPS heptosyltransferase
MQDATVPGLLTRLPAPPRKAVLLGEPRLGAYICLTPALRALRAALPDTEMVMITDATLRDLSRRTPYLDRFLPFPPLEGAHHARDVRPLTTFLQQMQEENFDLAIQLHGYGLWSCPFFVLLGAQVNAGFTGPADLPGLMEAALPFPREGHFVDRVLALTTFLGAPARGRATEFPLAEEDHRAARTLLAQAKPPLIGIHPSARNWQRQWPTRRFAELAVSLQARQRGTIVLLGERADADVEQIAGSIEGPCLNLAGRTPLPLLGAVIAHLSLLITNDTGPAHIGYALQTPTITLFDSHARTLFWPPEQGPFHALSCMGHEGEHGAGRCLRSIRVEQVIRKAGEILP